MTNDPFDDTERPIWEQGPEKDARFQAALRIDPLLNDWPKAAQRLAGWGYEVSGDLGHRDRDEVRRFLADWIKRIEPAIHGRLADARFPDARGQPARRP